MKTVELLIIGNEILAGEVRDSNAYWLSRRFTGMGAQVKRIAMVPDEPEAITRELKSSLSRRPDFLITAGGLGPTADDMTVKTVTEALNLKLVLNVSALNMVRSQYESFFKKGNVDSAQITESRRKMAFLPEDASPITNKVGGAPGVLLTHKGTKIICLPGVPDELKDIFDNGLREVFKESFSNVIYKERRAWVGHADETRISPIMDRVAEKNPNVYVKSLARPFDAQKRTEVILSASGKYEKDVNAQIEAAYKQLEQELSAVKISLSGSE